MKIYQVHEYGGEYEDYFDRIVGSYLRRECAEEMKEKLEAEEKQLRAKSDKCKQCLIHNEYYPTIEEYTEALRTYCDRAKITEDYFYINCENYFRLWEDSNYCIEEVEVEE